MPDDDKPLAPGTPAARIGAPSSPAIGRPTPVVNPIVMSAPDLQAQPTTGSVMTTTHGGGMSMRALDDYAPRPPRSLEETGLNEPFMMELVLKTLYFGGELRGSNLAERIGLAFQAIIYPILNKLKDERHIEIKGGGTMQANTWRYALTDRGHNLVTQILERNQYVGRSPVTLADYTKMVKRQFFPQDVGYEDIRRVFDDLVVEDDLIEKVGSAVISCKSMFLYGPPGNGKTSVAERICNVMRGAVFVPHAVEVANQVIKVYDPLDHRPPKGNYPTEGFDKRWMLCRRPMIIVGGELTLNMLDLSYSPAEKYYEAPFQLKSNGGLLLIDDFGRQMVHPKDLLNRWIVPLEKGTDYLTLHTGKKFEAPFRQLVVFSTNLEPRSLVDEAFLRRLRYKIKITNPSEPIFREIFKMVCEKKGVDYVPEGLDHLLHTHYYPKEVELRACHPRDLVEIIIDKARFRKQVPRLTPEAVDDAWAAYFVT